MEGVLLERAVYWKQYAKAKIPDVEGYWIANPRLWWMREAQLSSAQYDRASAKLRDLELIEKRQWWFGRRCILFLRPTAFTVDFITAGQTWQAAEEWLDSEDYEIDDSDEPGSAVLLDLNGFGHCAQPSSAISPNPKYIDTTHLILNEEEVCLGAHQASPSCAQFTGQAKDEVSGKKKKGSAAAPKATGPDSWLALPASPVTVKSMRNAWHAGMHKYYGEAVATVSDIFEFPPQEWKGLSLILQNLKCCYGPNGEEDLQAHAIDILIHAIRDWSALSKSGSKIPKYPNVTCIYEKLADQAISAWDYAGRPPHGLESFEAKGTAK
jgi:hypothetical protein